MHALSSHHSLAGRRWLLEGLIQDRAVGVDVRRKVLLALKVIPYVLKLRSQIGAAVGAAGKRGAVTVEVPGEYRELMAAAVARNVGAVCRWAAGWKPGEGIIRHFGASVGWSATPTVGQAGAHRRRGTGSHRRPAPADQGHGGRPMTTITDPVAIHGAAAAAKDGHASLGATAGGGAEPAAGDLSRAAHSIIAAAFRRGDVYAPSAAAIGAALGITGKRAGQILLSLRNRGLVFADPERCGGINRLRLRQVKRWHCPAPRERKPEGVRKTPGDLMAAVRFEDDPRAIRDMGTPGRPWLHAPSRHSLGGYCQYGR